jgi:type I restriction enzyme S subunit
MKRGWISDTLGSLVSVTGGGTPSRSVAAYWNGSVLWATVKDFEDVDGPYPD